MRQKWKTFVRAMGFVKKDVPGIWAMTLVTSAGEAVYPYIYIFFFAAILSELVSPDRSLKRLVFLTVLMGVCQLLGDLLLSFCEQLLNIQQYILMQHLDDTVYEAVRERYDHRDIVGGDSTVFCGAGKGRREPVGIFEPLVIPAPVYDAVFAVLRLRAVVGFSDAGAGI